ncbi:hypothetical protein HPB52_003161 [Rhipicephalus sanguineus]|uniref:Uncharacterized protein n=1 Tax=Rhipicephalus sanguineus TaxID=34632 RepID=A0A9D4STH3_RHISA|nr:hypothetical protein HPB52_003161 [Rhipicephalus sanguineus]
MATPRMDPSILEIADIIRYPAAEEAFLHFQRHVLRLLNTLRFMLEQQADTLNKLCDMLPTSSVTECAELLGHPLSSLEELQEFDDKLDAGKFKILILTETFATAQLLIPWSFWGY